MLILNKNRKIFIKKIEHQMVNLIMHGFESIYEKAKEVSKDNPKEILKTYQLFLKNIPNWSESLLEGEKSRILSKMDNDSILLLLINSYLKLSLIQLTGYSSELVLEFTSIGEAELIKIIHNIYMDVGKSLYMNPYLMYDEVVPLEYRKNINCIIEMIQDSLEKVLLDLLPWEEIAMRTLNVNKTMMFREKYISVGQSGGGIDLDKEVKNILSEMITNDNAKNIDSKMITPSKLNQGKLNIIDEVDESKLKDTNKEILSIIDKARNKYESNMEGGGSSDKVSKKTESKRERDNTTSSENMSVINKMKRSIKSDMSSKYMVDKKDSNTDITVEDKVVKIGGGKITSDVIENAKDSESSMMHVPESEDGFAGYADVFTNKNINTEEKTKKLSKNKYFSNYLKV